jgi:hypothetical protein
VRESHYRHNGDRKEGEVRGTGSGHRVSEREIKRFKRSGGKKERDIERKRVDGKLMGTEIGNLGSFVIILV